MGLLSSLQKIALAPSVFIGNTISNVIKPSSGTTTTSQLQATTAGKVLGTAIAGTGAALAYAAAPVGSISTAAKSLIPTTAKGKITAIVAAPVVAGILSKNPSAPFQAAGQLGELGADIGTFSANPSLQTAKDIVKGSPLISAAAGAAGLAAAGGLIIPAVSGYLTREEMQRQTAAFERQAAAAEAGGVFPVMSGLDNPVAAQDLPQGAQAQGSKASPKKRRKSRQQALQQTIRQSVRVNVNQKQSAHRISKRYLNYIN